MLSNLKHKEIQYTDGKVYIIILLHLRSGYVPSLANSVEILAKQHVKHGMKAKGFGAAQYLVQPLHSK